MLFGVVFLVLALVGAVAARLQLWSTPRRAPVRSGARPQGSVLGGADVVGSDVALAAQLIDWHVRGVVSVAAQGAAVAEDATNGVSAGPRWVITLGDRTGIADDEALALAGLFADDDPAGSTFLLAPNDQEARDGLQKSQDVARGARLEDFGPRVSTSPLLAVSFLLFAIAGAILVIVALLGALASIGLPAALILIGIVLLVVAGVVLLCRRPSRPSAAQIEFENQVRDLQEFVLTADAREVTADLVGWAMLWRVPLPWPTVLPPKLKPLVDYPTSFRAVKQPSPYDYVG